VNQRFGGLTPANDDVGTPWVSFANVRKQNTTGSAGPHMMLLDPSVRVEPGEH
jgi:hypothetical protein